VCGWYLRKSDKQKIAEIHTTQVDDFHPASVGLQRRATDDTAALNQLSIHKLLLFAPSRFSDSSSRER